MGVLFTNAILVDLDPIRAESAALRTDGSRIIERGPKLAPRPGDEVVDCGGCVVLAGLVNGHTHLYSALAVGMPPPPRMPRNFREVLELVWWRLDRALDAESTELSAQIGALAALHCGTTTLIDHHASPNCIPASLDRVENGLAAVGLRGVLCYETTDRHGRPGRDAGLEENRRYLAKHAATEVENRCFAGLVGAHASFTLDDDALDALAELAQEFDSGVHIHVAEDPCDEEDCQTRFQMLLIDRLAAHGLLAPKTVFAHGTHLDEDAVERVNRAGLTMAHNPRSNMHNAVGYAPVAAFRCPVMLGTDGIGGDMFAESKAAWLIARHEQAGASPADILHMSAAAARRASRALGVTLGKLEPAAVADVVVTDYRPFTPMTSENLVGHFLFGMDAGCVRDVMIGGRWALRERRACNCDEAEVRAAALRASMSMWERLARID